MVVIRHLRRCWTSIGTGRVSVSIGGCRCEERGYGSDIRHYPKILWSVVHLFDLQADSCLERESCSLWKE